MIYIPTFGRERVLTYENLPEILRRVTKLVVTERDLKRLQITYPEANFWVTPEQGKGAVKVKEAIYRGGAGPIVVMLDDDLSFLSSSFKDGKKKFRTASSPNICKAFQRLHEKAQEPGVGFTTFSTSFFNTSKELWVKNKRLAHTMFINKVNCLKNNVSFSGIPTMSDIKFVLECYTSGLCSYSLNNVAVKDCSVAADGGENKALGNRGEKFKKAIDYLERRWPLYVRRRDASGNKRHLANIGYPEDVTLYLARACKDWKR